MFDLQEVTTSSKEMFNGRVFKIKVDTVTLPDNTVAERELVIHNGGVAVVAVEDDYIYMVRQYRKAIEKTVLEIPAGKIEPQEEPHLCGMRELEEELGLVANDFISLGKMYPTPGYCSEIIHLYLAQDFKKTSQNLDEGEFLYVEKLKICDVLSMIENNKICDGKTIVGIYKALSYIKNNKK